MEKPPVLQPSSSLQNFPLSVPVPDEGPSVLRNAGAPRLNIQLRAGSFKPCLNVGIEYSEVLINSIFPRNDGYSSEDFSCLARSLRAAKP